MPQVEKIKIFLASPSNAPKERKYLVEVIDEINRTIASSKGVMLEIIRSENARPGFGEDGQAVLNNQIGEMQQYELFVGIMWNRIGTPTQRAVSGTVEEFERAAESLQKEGQPDIWFYFRQSGAQLNTEKELEQRQKVLEFKRTLQGKALIREYSTPTKFRDNFREHISSWLGRRESKTLQPSGTYSLPENVDTQTDQSEEEIPKFINQITEEIEKGELKLLKKTSLFKKQQIMTDEIINHIKQCLLNKFNGEETKITEHLKNFLVKHKSELSNNYAAGNILNLLLKLDLEKDFSYFDLSDISIWEADLQKAILTGVDFSNSDLKNSSFSEPLGCIHSIAFNTDGSLFATGDAHGSIRVHKTESLELCIFNNERGNQIWSVAFGSNTQYPQMLAWGAEDGSVVVKRKSNNVIDSSSDNITFTNIYQGNEDRRILSVAFSPNGNIFAIGGDGNKAIKLVEINNNQKGALDATDVSCMTFIDDDFIASGSQHGEISLWHLKTKKQDKNIQNVHEGVVRCIAFNQNRRILASGGEDGKVKMFSIPTLNQLEFDSPQEITQVRTLAFSQDGNILAVGGIDKNLEGQSEHKIWLWEFKEGRWSRMGKLDNLNKDGHEHLIRSLAFCPNPNQRQLLISGGDGRTVKFWDINNTQCNQTLRGYANRIWSVAFSGDGKSFACGGEDNKIRLWNYHDRTHIPTYTLSKHTAWVWSVAFSPNAKILASGSEDNKIFLWQLKKQKWQYISELKGQHNKRVRCVAFNPSGDRLASAGNDKKVVLWDISNVKNPRLLQEFTQHSDRVLSLAFSPNGLYLASSSRDHTIRLIDIKTRNGQSNLGDHEHRHQDQVHSIAFSPDSDKLVSGGFDKKLKLWEVPSGNCIQTWTEYQKILSVAFHPTKQIVASAGDNHIITLWDISDANNSKPTIIKTLKGHKRAVESIAFSPDGKKLISCSQDQTIKFWEIDGKINTSIHTIELGKPYQGMNISGVSNLDRSQISALEELGASKYLNFPDV
ncbi:WD-40 repeat protein [Cylindrospermum sp. NIES-4074]|nr:WD-40 repeat protein [Cylindrospermum sp. NIES-4074]